MENEDEKETIDTRAVSAKPRASSYTNPVDPPELIYEISEDVLIDLPLV